jgi:hypothetical protein
MSVRHPLIVATAAIVLLAGACGLSEDSSPRAIEAAQGVFPDFYATRAQQPDP